MSSLIYSQTKLPHYKSHLAPNMTILSNLLRKNISLPIASKKTKNASKEKNADVPNPTTSTQDSRPRKASSRTPQSNKIHNYFKKC